MGAASDRGTGGVAGRSTRSLAVMELARTSFAALGIVAVGCVSTLQHVGTFEGAGEASWMRVVLNADGSCVFVAGGIIGKHRDGIGGRCRYSEANDIISITDIGEIDGTGKTERVVPPLTLTYHAATDSLSVASNSSSKLFRVRN